jgi:hypothetical protein
MSSGEPFGFDAALRFELASDEGRAMLGSYVVATLLAVAWLALVQLVPRPLMGSFTKPDETIVTFDPVLPDLALPPVEARVPSAGEAARRVTSGSDSRGASNMRGLFGGNTGLVDAGQLLRGVEITRSGTGVREPTALKAGLGTGVGSRTPGITGTGGLSPTGAGVGVVRGNGVPRNAVTIAPPEASPIVEAPSAGTASAVGQIARTHAPQLERCYHDEGLTRNPSLAGLVRMRIDVEAGRVTSAQIVDRSWRGAGAAETEACLVRSVRGWRLGTSSAQVVLPLSFTSPARGSR